MLADSILRHLPSEEHQMLALLSVNSAAGVVNKLITKLSPGLSDVLTLSQIAVAAVTILWIFRRAKTAKLHNQKLEKQANRKPKRKQ